jgi:hypothetical protein
MKRAPLGVLEHIALRFIGEAGGAYLGQVVGIRGKITTGAGSVCNSQHPPSSACMLFSTNAAYTPGSLGIAIARAVERITA